NVGNVLTPLAFPGSKAYATNLANVFFGLGAFLTPLAVGWLLHRASLPVALSILGALTLLPGLLALGADLSQQVPAGEAAEKIGQARSWTDPLLWLCGLALFFYGPLEASMAAWTTTYLRDQGVKEETA